jgi:2,5-diamino-6-(ribosylamino)-4(3H)-pyrimidinone 5'-phosphate reductase
MSADGKIASPTRKQLRISSEEDLQRMYRLRHESDAVLVGIGTILADNPKLTVKESYIPHPRQPLRVILDSKGRTPADALALNDVSHTLILTTRGHKKEYQGSHIEVVECQADASGFVDIKKALEILFQKGVQSLLVEGGGTVIWRFLREKVVDDLYIYVGPCIIGGTDTPTVADGEGIHEEDVLPLKVVEVKPVGPGVLLHYHTL